MGKIIKLDDYRRKKEEKPRVFRSPEHERMSKLVEWLKLTPTKRMYPHNPEFWESTCQH